MSNTKARRKRRPKPETHFHNDIDDDMPPIEKVPLHPLRDRRHDLPTRVRAVPGYGYSVSIGRRGREVAHDSIGGVVKIAMTSSTSAMIHPMDVDTIEIEAYRRPGNPVGLMIRGLDCLLDIEPRGDNTIIVKPRPR